MNEFPCDLQTASLLIPCQNKSQIPCECDLLQTVSHPKKASVAQKRSPSAVVPAFQLSSACDSDIIENLSRAK